LNRRRGPAKEIVVQVIVPCAGAEVLQLQRFSRAGEEQVHIKCRVAGSCAGAGAVAEVQRGW